MRKIVTLLVLMLVGFAAFAERKTDIRHTRTGDCLISYEQSPAMKYWKTGKNVAREINTIGCKSLIGSEVVTIRDYIVNPKSLEAAGIKKAKKYGNCVIVKPDGVAAAYYMIDKSNLMIVYFNHR